MRKPKAPEKGKTESPARPSRPTVPTMSESDVEANAGLAQGRATAMQVTTRARARRTAAVRSEVQAGEVPDGGEMGSERVEGRAAVARRPALRTASRTGPTASRCLA
eukprot:scaffold4943_cov117-Pinguiococcus_pyrenoidosus.AAC.1